MNATDKIQKLIPCEVCSKEIATLADKCPNCGAPNKWIHPTIKEFMENMPGDIPREYWVHYKKNRIWGYTEEKFPLWMWIIVICCAVPGLAFGFIPGLIIGPLAYFILLKMYGKKLEFAADCDSGEWVSNDDDFWKPVREALKV